MCLVYDEKYQAIELLENYVTRNPEYPWAQERLYDLYGKNHPEKTLELLKVIFVDSRHDECDFIINLHSIS